MNFINKIKRLRKAIRWIIASTPLRSQFGYCAENAVIHYPIRIYNPKGLYLYENTSLAHDILVINTSKEKVIIKRNSVVAAKTTFVTNNHVSTVSVPIFLLHTNDISKDIIVEEECWIGTGAIILAGSRLGRGCIVGAGCIVNKDVPPYAVVVGCPARIIAVKFSIAQIIEHEKALYSEKERFSSDYLQKLFDTFFKGKKIYGTSDGIDKNALELIEKKKKRIHYIEPNLK